MTSHDTPPLSRLVPVAEIPSGGLTVTLAPTEAECRALAAFNGIVAVKALRAVLTLRPEGRDGVHVAGEVSGEVAQICVVSGEVFDAPLRERIDVHFLAPPALEAYRAAHASRPREDEEAEDEPDQIRAGQIDVGSLVAEHVTLGLDPYPRKPGAVLGPEAMGEEPTASPFSILKALGEKRS